MGIFPLTSPDNPSLGKPRVLVVDDCEDILTRTSQVLSRGYVVVVGAVTGGREALEAAQALCPDIIVLDISMPDMTGLEVARRLRESGSSARVVFLTIHAEDEIAREAKALGIGYVLKPRLASDLMPAIAEALAGRPFVSPLG